MMKFIDVFAVEWKQDDWEWFEHRTDREVRGLDLWRQGFELGEDFTTGTHVISEDELIEMRMRGEIQ